MDITITINCDNAAFEGDPVPEITRILHELIDDLDFSEGKQKLRDVNGNVVGFYEIQD